MSGKAIIGHHFNRLGSTPGPSLSSRREKDKRGVEGRRRHQAVTTPSHSLQQSVSHIASHYRRPSAPGRPLIGQAGASVETIRVARWLLVGRFRGRRRRRRTTRGQANEKEIGVWRGGPPSTHPTWPSLSEADTTVCTVHCTYLQQLPECRRTLDHPQNQPQNQHHHSALERALLLVRLLCTVHSAAMRCAAAATTGGA
jgi:hypothetical protein